MGGCWFSRLQVWQSRTVGKVNYIGNAVVSCFSVMFLKGDYGCWNLKDQARKCAVMLAFRIPKQLREE